MLIVWPVVALGYYGVALSMSSIGGDVFTSNLLSALVEIVANIATLLLVDVWGRKPLLSFFLFLTGFNICKFQF